MPRSRVMPRLEPGIHIQAFGLDGRVKPGHDAGL